MFTGIVQAIGHIEKLKPLQVAAGRLPLGDVRIGDSISVQGCCLTVVKKTKGRLWFDVSRETLRVTAGLDRPGGVNLEKSLGLGDKLGGHLVTGHVDGVGVVLKHKNGFLQVRAPKALSGYIARKGSICIDGVSLTVVKKAKRKLWFDVSKETLRVTAGLDRPGAVNLEKSLGLGDKLGGHLVTGHVDGVGRLKSKKGSEYTFAAPQSLARYVARKGSICIDGVSLTVNRVKGAKFEVNLIPHTVKVTTLKRLTSGAKVNLEVDLVARYLERMLQAR